MDIQSLSQTPSVRGVGGSSPSDMARRNAESFKSALAAADHQKSRVALIDGSPAAGDPGSPPRAAATEPSLDKLAAARRSGAEQDDPLRKAFQDFVGQTLFGSMLSAMRKTVGKPAYLHGGRAEEVFQEQLDQHIVKDLSEASASEISEPMYELFTMQRRA